MAAETERGGAREAIHPSGIESNQVGIDDLPTITRKASFLLDLGKVRERDDLARCNPVVRNMIRTLVKRGSPSSARQLRAMARRLRVAV